MKEFLPWSKSTFESATETYLNGRFSILDVQLGSGCDGFCGYCDTPNRNLPCEINFDKLYSLIQQENGLYKWMFICGLGEPLWAGNKPILMQVLSFCQQSEIKCSIFTNGFQFDDEILEYVKAGVLFPLIKLDSFSLDKAVEIYRTDAAKKNLDSVGKLFDYARNTNFDYCQVAASIVPSKKNLNEVVDIVQKCVENNVFPMLGQLEYAGLAVDNYDEYLLTKDELLKLKSEISDVIGVEYSTPFCPSVIAGIPIAYNNIVTVDKRSGLSCAWFWLEDPDMHELCNINDIDSFLVAEKAILDYRKTTISNMEKIADEIEIHPFGGCGGNVRNLLQKYVTLQSSVAK